ncbi:hypothetical protein BC831DRAFT_446279 [Entophlyctis helioformis]|nr:hypothetical protein BC831DRAFT_446279 [Entophlyctis helioformis]
MLFGVVAVCIFKCTNGCDIDSWRRSAVCKKGLGMRSIATVVLELLLARLVPSCPGFGSLLLLLLEVLLPLGDDACSHDSNADASNASMQPSPSVFPSRV